MVHLISISTAEIDDTTMSVVASPSSVASSDVVEIVGDPDDWYRTRSPKCQ